MSNASLRWQQFVPRLLSIFVLLLSGQYLLGLAARQLAVHSTEAALEANVEVEQAHVSLWSRQIQLGNLKVGDPCPPSNFQLVADYCELDFAIWPFAHKRTVIEKGRLTGLRFVPGDSGSCEAARRVLPAGAGDDPLRKTLADINDRIEQLTIDEFKSVEKVGLLCSRWPQVRAELRRRAGQLTRRADELRATAGTADDNRLRHEKFLRALPANTAAIERELSKFDAQVRKLESMIETERRAIVAARQHDERIVREQLRFAAADPQLLGDGLLQDHVAAQVEELMAWLRWMRQIAPSDAPSKSRQPRGEEILFAGCAPVPGFLVREMQFEGAASVGGKPVELAGVLANVSNDLARQSGPLVLRLASAGSPHIVARATIDRTGALARDELVVECRDVTLPGCTLGRERGLAMRVAPSAATASINVSLEGDLITGEILLAQKEVAMAVAPSDALGHLSLQGPLDVKLGETESLVTRLELMGTLAEPGYEVQSNLGAIVAEAMDLAVLAAADKRAKALLAEARQHVDEQLADLERQFSAERIELSADLKRAADQVAELVAEQKTGERLSVEQLGRRLPENSLFR